MGHVCRVFRLTQRFATELDADSEVVGCAALTHDPHRVLGGGTGRDSEDTFQVVGRVLDGVSVAPENVSEVQHCVAVHDDLSFRGNDPQPETLGAKVLRAADNLDAMGAVGIARTFSFGGDNGTSLWDPDGRQYSQLYHFDDKLLRLREELHTEPAQNMADDRYVFLERSTSGSGRSGTAKRKTTRTGCRSWQLPEQALFASGRCVDASSPAPSAQAGADCTSIFPAT